ncbi:MAG: hypothetical protein J6A16_02025 [Oscillospiraceae bacterium]|nr:hypothetical protein [Oscillospiraceae bacterium]
MTVAEFYRSEWGGIFEGTDEELAVLLRRAESIIDEAIMISGVTVAAAPDVYRDRLLMAVCAQADYIEAHGGVYALSDDSSGGSVTLGRFSYSAGSGMSTAVGAAACVLCPHAQTILRPTGLLFRGVEIQT